PNSIGDPVARHSLRRIVQLPRGALLSTAHRARGLFNVLLQAADCIRQGVLAFTELLTLSLRIRILPTPPRKVFHVFGDLTLARCGLGGALAQIANLLLASRCACLSARLSVRLLQATLRFAQLVERAF